jgi:hypothetical protein
MQTSRRTIITGLVSLIAAPAVVRADSIMPVKAWKPYRVAPGLYIYNDEGFLTRFIPRAEVVGSWAGYMASTNKMVLAMPDGECATFYGSPLRDEVRIEIAGPPATFSHLDAARGKESPIWRR